MGLLAPQTPQEDPSFLAYLRGQGYQESELRNEVATRTGALQRELANRLPSFADQLDQGLENTSNEYDSRGMFSSGQRLAAQQRVATDVGRERVGFEQSIADQQTALQANLASQIAASRRAAAEQALSTSGNLLVGAARQGIY